MKALKRIGVPIAVVAAVLLLLTLLLFGTFRSLQERSRTLVARETLRQACVAVSIWLETEAERGEARDDFSGCLIYFEDPADAERDAFFETVALLPIDAETLAALADSVSDEAILPLSDAAELPSEGYIAAAGPGVTKIADSVLHDALLPLGVVLYLAL